MAGAAAATAGFFAAAVHALAEVSSGELVRGPTWALVLVLSVAGALLSARVLLAVVAAAVGAALDVLRPRGLTARRVDSLAMALAPAALRPLLCGVLVAGAAVTLAPPALAAPAAAATAVHTSERATHQSTHQSTDDLPAPGWPALSGNWRPQAPAARGRPGVELVTSGGTRCTPDGEVVVRRGDTLWDLAARSLGPGASDAEIAAAWPRWWHANHAAIGPDPDLLLPGTRLCVPYDAADRSPR